MPRPRILIPCPTSFDTPYNRLCWPEYAAGVEQAGGEAVMVPLEATPNELDRFIQSANGIVLPGSGADVSPERYGHERHPETAPADPLREQVDLHLLEQAHRLSIPTLAICFCVQSLNVYRGGTLVQHLLPMPVNHRAGRPVPQAHATVIAGESKLGRLLAGTPDAQPDANEGFLRLMVNSSHHQAVGAPGDGLQIVGRSTEDAVIEAVEDPAHPFLVGVQWHPERTLNQSEASQRIFTALLHAAKPHA